MLHVRRQRDIEQTGTRPEHEQEYARPDVAGRPTGIDVDDAALHRKQQKGTDGHTNSAQGQNSQLNTTSRPDACQDAANADAADQGN